MRQIDKTRIPVVTDHLSDKRGEWLSLGGRNLLLLSLALSGILWGRYTLGTPGAAGLAYYSEQQIA
jgi:hypothetical protein